MARLASTDVSSFLALNPRFLEYLNAEKASLSVKASLIDVTVLPNATEARMLLTLSAEPRDTVIGSYSSRNGIGTNSGSNYTAVKGAFIFHPGGPTSMEIVIPLKGNNAVGRTIEIVMSSTIAGAAVGDALGKVLFADVIAPAPTGYTLVWETDFITDFEASDTGLKADGSGPCWQSRPAHGRDQVGNHELGLYTDPLLYPGTDPFPIVDGKRVLRGEKLAAPLTYGSKSFNFTASMITSRKLRAIAPGGRLECRLAMPVLGKRGAWPAFWLMPMSGAWPPEMDMMEWPINATANAWTYYTTQHWPTSNKRAYPIDTRLLGATEDLTNFHTYGIEITDQDIICTFDGIKTTVMENRSPGQSWYILLNMAIGGDWPGAPTAGTVFPCDMTLDWLKLYEPTI